MPLNVWAVWPTVNIERTQKMIPIWRVKGYKVAVLLDFNRYVKLDCDMLLVQERWQGFPVAANLLCHSVPGDIVVVIGDDVYPDLKLTAQDIAKDFIKKFPSTFGVMQPIGDDFGSTKICAVSPWVGRKFIEEMYGGYGPFCTDYFHYYTDHELQIIATKYNAFYQRSDVTQFHDHWQRKENPERPQYLLKAGELWHRDEIIFKQRKAAGFPNHRRNAMDMSLQRKAWCDLFAKGPGELETINGYGSYLEHTKEIRLALPRIFTKYKIKTFTDIPCGDWNWMRRVNLRGIDYLGLDIVPKQIEQNKNQFPTMKFEVANVVIDPIRESDLILCRDLFFHLSNDLVYAAIQNFRKSTKLLLSTSFPKIEKNDNLPDSPAIMWRPINLMLPPFCLDKPIEIIQENNSHACRGRIVGLFKI